MGQYNDIMTIECEHEVETEMDYYAAMQRTINAGTWGLQGSFGRAMMDAISSGQCLLGTSDARDYYGNHIPSRDQVKDGTKGSRSFVVEAMGEEWATHMEAQP
jgi:hypothetical protein